MQKNVQEKSVYASPSAQSHHSPQPRTPNHNMQKYKNPKNINNKKYLKLPTNCNSITTSIRASIIITFLCIFPYISPYYPISTVRYKYAHIFKCKSLFVSRFVVTLVIGAIAITQIARNHVCAGKVPGTFT